MAEEKLNIVKEIISRFLQSLFEDDKYQYEVELISQNEIKIYIGGEYSAYLIGKKGNTLLALQHIIRQIYIQNTGDFAENVKLIIDVDNYKRKRLEKLYQIVEKYVNENSDKERIALPSMKASDRKIIHNYIAQKYPQYTTKSEGEEPRRRVVLFLNNAQKNQ
ncbi:MAG: KH domain-containing protein [Candidatus Dojkabacteria bacterium]|nr:KH domain-containing protein [Candidatus Dojkabacteria bacterium]